MTIGALVEKYNKKPHKSFRRIGGGYYADVYKVKYRDGETAVVKVYKTDGVMQSERLQLDVLAGYSLAEMPKVRWVHNADGDFDRDVLCMNHLEGTVGGAVWYFSAAKRKKLADSVADCLIAFHNVRSPDGFGELGSAVRYETFNEYYKIRAAEILKMAERLEEKGQLTADAADTLRRGYAQFERIFYLPITEAVLIHGDYNMWNILVDKGKCSVSAVIDPYGCIWADSESDLYQLDSVNGRHLGLLEAYASKRGLSENCMQKMAFYELFNSVEHYYTSGHPVRKRKMKKRVAALKKYLEV